MTEERQPLFFKPNQIPMSGLGSAFVLDARPIVDMLQEGLISRDGIPSKQKQAAVDELLRLTEDQLACKQNSKEVR